jgi:hypothetical protein
VAERWRAGNPGRRVGRAQRPGPDAVYAKCVYGQDEAARRRIEAALTADEPTAREDLQANFGDADAT